MADNSLTTVNTAGSTWIGKCIITLINGQQFDLKENLKEISIHEDIFNFCTSGYISLRDGLGLVNTFGLMGGEGLAIQFDYFNNEDAPTRYFTLYKIGDRKATGNLNSESFKLYFCNSDLLINQQMRVPKAYTGVLISDIVKDILTNFLQTKTPFTKNISSTQGAINYVAPNMYPYQTISYLSQYAIPTNSGSSGAIGADMLFFQNIFGYNFYSVAELASNPPTLKYSYQQNNIDDSVANLAEDSDAVIALEHVKSFDILDNITRGAFANKVVAFDSVSQTKVTTTFDYNAYINEIPPVNGLGIQPLIYMPDGQTMLNQTPDSHLMVVTTNSGDASLPYVQSNSGQSINSDLFVASSLSYRTAQLALMRNMVLKIVVPGSSVITVGQTLFLSYYALQFSNDARPLDSTISGLYLVTAVRHIVQSQGVYHTVIEICKSSNLTQNV